MSELTDLEILIAVAGIEFGNHSDKWFISEGIVSYWAGDGIFGGFKEYNPLTDDALCFKLMVKYEVDIDFYLDVARIQSDYTDGRPDKGRWCFAGGLINHAICLAIIEAHKDQS